VVGGEGVLGVSVLIPSLLVADRLSDSLGLARIQTLASERSERERVF
jgi:hypothetical protein